MLARGSAFGLSIEARFPLGQLGPAEGGRTLALELSSPRRPAAAFGRAARTGLWRGRLGDGEELAIGWGPAGDLCFRYGRLALFRLDPGRALLECAPAQPRAAEWRRVLLTRILPNVAIAAGFEALHASAVSTRIGVLAFLAPAGGGKSTLALEFLRRGHPLFADDTVVLSREAGTVLAHPAGPSMNLPVGAQPPPGAADLGCLGRERWVAVAEPARRPSEVAAIVLLERGPGRRLELGPAHRSPLALAPFMLGLPDQADREAGRFSLYSDLVEGARLIRLGAAPSDRPGELADTLEEALELSPPALLGTGI